AGGGERAAEFRRAGAVYKDTAPAGCADHRARAEHQRSAGGSSIVVDGQTPTGWIQQAAGSVRGEVDRLHAGDVRVHVDVQHIAHTSSNTVTAGKRRPSDFM